MPRIRWTHSEPAVSPGIRLRLDPGEQDITDEQYAALAGNPDVELVGEPSAPAYDLAPIADEPVPAPTPEPAPTFEPAPMAEPLNT